MSSHASHASHAPAKASGAALPSKLTTVYNIVITPILFISFIASLAWVDFRYTLMRSHSHSEDPSRMPRWLHRILYREAPYKYIKVNAKKPNAPAADSDDDTRWHYHSKQRKLMKMEVSDAFQIRSTVLVVLGLSAVVATWALWWVVWWIRNLATTKLGWAA